MVIEDKLFIHKLLNSTVKKDSKDLMRLVSLCDKYPDFTIIHLLLLKFPADVFNNSLWIKAENIESNLNDLQKSYFPIKIEIPERLAFYQKVVDKENKTQIKEKQSLLIKKFLKYTYM